MNIKRIFDSRNPVATEMTLEEYESKVAKTLDILGEGWFLTDDYTYGPGGIKGPDGAVWVEFQKIIECPSNTDFGYLSVQKKKEQKKVREKSNELNSLWGNYAQDSYFSHRCLLYIRMRVRFIN